MGCGIINNNSSYIYTMRFLIFIILIFFLGLVIYNGVYLKSRTSSMAQTVQFTTEDNTTIVADFYPVEGSSLGVILVHMMPSDRKSWIPFAEKLKQAGFQVLAIDLRGHGESQGGPSGYEKFSDTEHQNSYKDIAAADDFLRRKGATNINIAGASIGANLALWYLADHAYVRSAVLLSAGFDYQGIQTGTSIGRVRRLQGVYFVGSAEDEQSGASASDVAVKLFSLCGCINKEVKEFNGAGHGTTMLDRNPEFMDRLIHWIRAQN